MSGREIRVLIADDHPIFREGLKKVILRDPQLQVVGEAEDGEDAIARLTEVTADVAVLDLDMPRQDGFAVMRAIREAKLDTKVIILTMHKSEDLFHSAFDLGACGYVLKDGAIAEIVNGVRTVAAGGHYISPELSTYLLNRANHFATLAKQTPTVHDLTPTERRILKLIAEDKTSREIAAELFVSVRTVDHHRAHICEKLNLHGINSLMKFAIKHKNALP